MRGYYISYNGKELPRICVDSRFSPSTVTSQNLLYRRRDISFGEEVIDVRPSGTLIWMSVLTSWESLGRDSPVPILFTGDPVG